MDFALQNIPIFATISLAGALSSAVEQLVYTEWAGGSTPSARTDKTKAPPLSFVRRRIHSRGGAFVLLCEMIKKLGIQFIEILKQFCHEHRAGAAGCFGIADIFFIRAGGVEIADDLSIRVAGKAEVDYDRSLF